MHQITNGPFKTSERPRQKIEDYAMIGDCNSAALVGRDGSIDWLCWPRFDSDACFAALLGGEENGRWRLMPKHGATGVSRRYRPNTLVLETRFETDEGVATLIDFMPVRCGGSHIVRMIKGERGRVEFCSELVMRFGYGAVVPWVTRCDDHTWRGIAGPDMIVLRAPTRMHGENLRTVGDVTVREGETLGFVLSYAPSDQPLPKAIDVQQCLQSTEKFWTDWIARNRIEGSWSDAVNRSLITLKALTYGPTGGIVAAPTTSLPEHIGGQRNWDYRFCWLRDATLTLLALMNAGYFEEAGRWREWLLRAVAGSPNQAQIMYGLAGERRLTEWEVPWLAGYENSRPVRIGNAAYSQVQLDVLGELMDTLHQAREGGLAASDDGWALERAFLQHLEKIWTRPDSGIWEVRDEVEHFTYSKVMAWVAFDRAIRSAEEFNLEGDIDRWKKLRADIHADICSKAYDAARNTFVRAYGKPDLDASLLLLPAVGFLPATDPRIRGTIEAIERDLVVDGLLLRYDTHRAGDGLPPGEGVFLACSFWLVDAYLMLGRRDDAVRLFERLLSLRNDVGLLSEQYDPVANRLLGNFPQALSHLALVNTASNLSHREKPAEQRAQAEVIKKPDLQGAGDGRR